MLYLFFTLLFSGSLSEFLWQKETVENFLDINIKDEFESWKLHFNKEYSSRIEEELRLIIFTKNWFNINKHNKDGKHSYTLKLNQFGDLTEDEFNKYNNKKKKHHSTFN